MDSCARCTAGPDGLEGHQELTLKMDGQPRYGQAKGHHLFECVACSIVWERHYDGGGAFRWRRQDGRRG